MEPGFFQSKAFLASGIVALVIIAGGAVAYAWVGPDESGFFGARSHHACDAITLSGASLPTPTPVDETTGSGRDTTRTITYDVNVTTRTIALLAACASVGDITIEPSPDNAAHVVFVVHGEARAVADTGVTLALATRSTDGALQLAAWQSRAGSSGAAYNTQGASVSVTLRAPEAGAPDVRATTDVGDALVSQLLVGNVTIATDVGRARAVGVDITGNVTLTSDVDDIELRASSIQSSRVTLSSDVGDITVALPARADLGYDATASADVGDVQVDIGPTEARETSSEGSGGHAHARSKDYDAKLAKVVLTASANVGDVRVTAK